VSSPDPRGDAHPDGRTSFQIEAARLFSALPSSAGFIRAGGAALLAQHLTIRPTQDLDFFTSQGNGDVTTAAEGFEFAAEERGWTVTRIRESATFTRLVIDSSEHLPGQCPRLATRRATHSQPRRTDLRPRRTGRPQGHRPLRPRQKDATSPTFTPSHPDSENPCCSPAQPRSTWDSIASSPTCFEC
jgi:hypothetical protein